MRDTIDMAREAGAHSSHNPDLWDIWEISDEALKRLVAIVRADERDACAQSSVGLAINASLDRTAEFKSGVYSDIASDGGMDPRNQPEPQRWAVFCGGCRKQGSVAYQHPGKTICDNCVAKLRGTTPKQTSIETAMDEVAHRLAHRLALDLECVLAKYDGPWYDQAWETLSQYRSEMNKLHEQVSPTFMGEPLIKDAP